MPPGRGLVRPHRGKYLKVWPAAGANQSDDSNQLERKCGPRSDFAAGIPFMYLFRQIKFWSWDDPLPLRDPSERQSASPPLGSSSARPSENPTTILLHDYLCKQVQF
jgi:hypothetical protein